MVGSARSLGVMGLNGYEVGIECHLSGGLPNFNLVGLPDATVRESRERVRAAAQNSGLSFPQRNITVNLTPADKRKEGSLYDLPILLGILAADGALAVPPDAAFLGELSLSGELRPVSGVLSMAIAAADAGISALYVPSDNAGEASLARRLTVYGVDTVRGLLDHLAGQTPLTPCAPWRPSEAEAALQPDFMNVRGQENIKRALEIAAAGGHNVLMNGPPGAGKSMLARRMPSILPRLTYEEALECTQIYSAARLLSPKRPLMDTRPFRAPHHTVSTAGLSGGGSAPKPGEISLAHNGVLFLDELPEFSRPALESLRQPMEDGMLTISRANMALTYPARFMLIAAMNPCKCGWRGHPSGKCKCSEASLSAYRDRLSGPLLDRIDLHVGVRGVAYYELTEPAKAEPSETIRRRVEAARAIQRARYGDARVCNAHLPAELREKFCALDAEASGLLKAAFDRLGLSARSYDRVVKVARTVADLAGAENIGAAHVAEALQYRQQTR